MEGYIFLRPYNTINTIDFSDGIEDIKGIDPIPSIPYRSIPSIPWVQDFLPCEPGFSENADFGPEIQIFRKKGKLVFWLILCSEMNSNVFQNRPNGIFSQSKIDIPK